MDVSTKRRPEISLINLDATRKVTVNTEIGTLMDKWLEYKRELVKDGTYSNWVLTTENHIKPFFNGITLGDITEGDLQDFIMYLYTDGKKDGKGGFCSRSIRNLILPLKQALDYAYKYNRRLEKLDWSVLEYPKDKKADHVKAMPYEEQVRFRQAVYLNLNRKTAAYLITLYTGLRIGEICGLQMHDISLSQHTISVSRTVQRLYDKKQGKTKVLVSTPKTENSVRTIPFPPLLIAVIEPFYSAKAPDCYFITGKQKPCEPRTLRRHFDRFLKQNCFKKMKYHELRHTFATRAMELPDFDIKSLSAILGHNNPAFTLNVYGRANIEQEIACMEQMNKLL